MRNYAKSSPKFWVQGSGRRLRGDHIGQLAAKYLISAPESNMLGLYYLNLPGMAHLIGSPLGGATEALRRACRAGFCAFDQASDLVWIFNAAEIEFGESLKSNDNNIGSIGKLLKSFGKHPFVQAFLHRYGEPFHLDIGIDPSPLEGPWEPLHSPSGGGSTKEQEQEQEQEEEKNILVPQAETSAPGRGRKRSPEEQARAKLVRDAFFAGHWGFYGKVPDQWGAPENSHVYHLLKSSSAEVLAAKARAYFVWPNPKAISAGHPFMNHPASFSTSLAEIKADMIAPERRAVAAKVTKRQREQDRGAEQQDQLARAVAQATGESHAIAGASPGAGGEGSAALRDARPLALDAGADGVAGAADAELWPGDDPGPQGWLP